MLVTVRVLVGKTGPRTTRRPYEPVPVRILRLAPSGENSGEPKEGPTRVCRNPRSRGLQRHSRPVEGRYRTLVGTVTTLGPPPPPTRPPATGR